jgi:tRNA1Val (adenine37-N6)-methyltransferase
MSSSSFRFKQFEVFHDRCAMKVGLDGVLLGAWAKPPICPKRQD